jgi:hypothetical protein
MPLDHLPIPESDLIDYVEGCLPGARRVEVAGTLRQHPDLARLVAGMQDDRRALTSLPMAAAPAGLIERIESQLEREALLGVAGDRRAAAFSTMGAMGAREGGVEGAGRALRVSTLVPERPGVIARIRSMRAARSLAVAAGLVLIGGAAVYTVYTAVREISLSGPRTGRTLARAGDRDALDHEPALTPPEVSAPAADSRLAALPPADATAADATRVDAPEGPPTLTRADHALDRDGTPPHDDPLAITPAHALQLAREGRLAIVVRCADPDLAVKRVERLAAAIRAESGPVDAVRLARLEPASLAPPIAPLAALWTPRAAVVRSPGVDPTALASGRPALDPGLAEDARSPADAARPPLPAPPAAAFTIEVDDSESSLAALRPALSTSGQTGPRVLARFVALPEPIDVGPSLDPAAIVWWNAPPARWVLRWTVPIVVESPR